MYFFPSNSLPHPVLHDLSVKLPESQLS